MDSSTLLFDVSPLVIQRLCHIMDNGDERLGWRGLAVRIMPSMLDVRRLERMEATGRSPTWELLWSWAQQNPCVQDLLRLLQDMGHNRALQLFQGHVNTPFSTLQELPLAPGSQHGQSTVGTSAGRVEESVQLEGCDSSQALRPWKSPKEQQPPVVTFQDILEGTREFHPDMRISQGHFSDIYRAQRGSQTFAVKIFKKINAASWKKQWDIFRKEMEIHHLYQHQNILELLGCFSNESRYCLVYPYLPNGSLFHRIHHQDAPPPLSWQERLTIIKGIAAALNHLHTAQPSAVICGNVSSANVLLDDALQPKLSDFGLAHLRPHSASHHLTIMLDTRSHSNPGYLPEEYIRDGKLSLSLDVYSFGMVLMETLTGRKVIQDQPRRTWLRDLLASEVENSGGINSCLKLLDAAAGQWVSAVALSLLDLALKCTTCHHRRRPSMKDVLLALSPLCPPPSCSYLDQPHTLDDGAPVDVQGNPSSCRPVEHDEQRSPPSSPADPGPCESSQSDVTYRSDARGVSGEATADLYCSWPVQCSCQVETGGLICEDCRANGFTSD
ncbi:interleukin-1 receptor-associated kinase 3 [Aulostomus maculatus]